MRTMTMTGPIDLDALTLDDVPRAPCAVGR